MVSVRVIIIQFFCKIEFGRGTCNLDQHIYKALLLKIQFFIFIFLILKKKESWDMEFIKNIGVANSTLHFRANTFFPYSHHFIITQFYQRRFFFIRNADVLVMTIDIRTTSNPLRCLKKLGLSYWAWTNKSHGWKENKVHLYLSIK